MSAAVWIGNILMASGVAVMAVGVYGILRYTALFTRILIASKIDTMGLILILTGAMVRTGLNFHSLKILLILVFAILTNPMVTHAVARSAYASGRRPEEGKEDGNRG